jgi:hypothetical protein
MVAVEMIAAAVAGGCGSLLLLGAFDPRGQVTDMDLIAFVAGAFVAVGITRFVRS